MEQPKTLAAGPLVSVAMAAFNGEHYLPAQLESIRGQLAPGDELAIVDDASTDGTAALLLAWRGPYLRVGRNARNAGVLAAFERALRLARHDIILLADQDDVWLPGKRDALCAAFAADPQVMVAISDAQLIDGEGLVTADSFMASRGGFRSGVLDTVLKNRYLGCAMAIRRSVLARALPFPPDLPMHDMWLGAIGSMMGKVAYIDRPLMQYRRHGGNASPSTHASLVRMTIWRWRLLRNLVLRRLAAPVPVPPAGGPVESNDAPSETPPAASP